MLQDKAVIILRSKDKYGKDIFIVLKSISNVGEDIPFKNLELNQARKLGFSYCLIISKYIERPT